MQEVVEEVVMVMEHQEQVEQVEVAQVEELQVQLQE
jgi:hypothetical protein